MYLYLLKAIFIHLEISIKLLMFDLLYPADHKADMIFPFIYVHIILIIILADFHKNCCTIILRVSVKWRDCL